MEHWFIQAQRATREQEHVCLHATGHLFALACQITFCSRQLWLPPRQIELQQVPGKPRNFWGIEVYATVKHLLCLEPAYTWKDWWGQSEPQGKEPNGAYERNIPTGAEPPAASDWMEIAYQMPSLLKRRLKFSFHIWISRMRMLWQQGLHELVRIWWGDLLRLAAMPCAWPPAPAGGALSSLLMNLKTYRKCNFLFLINTTLKLAGSQKITGSNHSLKIHYHKTKSPKHYGSCL